MSEKHRVMVVDDNADAAYLLGKLLERLGYIARVVTQSTQTLVDLLDFRPHVVLLDIAMPELTGYDVAKQIRQQVGFEKVPLIAISGYSGRDHEAMSLEAGIDHFLVKPVGMADLGPLLISAIGNQP